MVNDIVVKMWVEGDYVALTTYSRRHGHRGEFLLYLDELREWLLEYYGEWHLRDRFNGHSVGLQVIDGAVRAEVYWCDDGPDAPGFYQVFFLPVAPLQALLRDGTPLRQLCMPRQRSPRIAARNHALKTIRRVSGDKLARRALSKALRDIQGQDFSERQDVTIALLPNGRHSFSYDIPSHRSSGNLILHETSIQTPVGRKPLLYYYIYP